MHQIARPIHPTRPDKGSVCHRAEPPPATHHEVVVPAAQRCGESVGSRCGNDIAVCEGERRNHDEGDFGDVLSHDVVEGGCLLGKSRRCVDLVQDDLGRQALFGRGWDRLVQERRAVPDWQDEAPRASWISDISSKSADTTHMS
ncbi:hypothetical protein HBI42_219680 [Parastagonospora nodorum]|nr:hypothetical protein HBI42_219680 [Parastagonospora nodorum]